MSEGDDQLEVSAVEQLIVQEDFFGIEVDYYRPVLGGTAHLRRTAIGSDGQEYAIKSITDGEASSINPGVHPQQIPAAEWLCTKLGEKCGLPTPSCKILKDSATGEHFFGSRYELAAMSTPIQEVQFVDALKGESLLMKKQLWAIYAFDQFVFNIDRHFGNYLYTSNREGILTVQAFDFSLAAMVMGWPNKTPHGLLPPDVNTSVSWRFINALTQAENACIDSAVSVLDRLDAINADVIESIFKEMPEAWVNPLLRDALLAWWSSQDKMLRINTIRTEVSK